MIDLGIDPAENGGMSAPVYSCATTSGRSMSPSMKSTSTSVPMRGANCEPQFGPASASATRTQVPEASLPGA